MAGENGVTRREFEDLKRQVYELERDLRREFQDLDRNGTRAMGELRLVVNQLVVSVGEIKANWNSLSKGIIGIVFTVLAAFIVLAVTGVIGGN